MKKIIFFSVLFLLVSAIGARESCKSTNKAGLNSAYAEVRVIRTIQNILLPSSQAEVFVGYMSRSGQHNGSYNFKHLSSEINEVKTEPKKSGKPP